MEELDHVNWKLFNNYLQNTRKQLKMNVYMSYFV